MEYKLREILVESLDDAHAVLNTLFTLKQQRNYATVGDLYRLVSDNSNTYLDERYGWTNFTGFKVAKVEINKVEVGYSIIPTDPELIT